MAAKRAVVFLSGAAGDTRKSEMVGSSFSLHEWRGSGPTQMHVHHSDDEAWHVLGGALTFRFGEETVQAPAGTTVFVPAGVPHTYSAEADTRYLIVLTSRLRALIAALQANQDRSRDSEIYRQYDSELIEGGVD